MPSATRSTKARNTAAFDDCDLVPNVLAGVAEVDMRTTVMGREIAMPLMLSPTALQRLFHWQGERGVGAAAQKFGTWFGISSLATDHLLVPKLMKALKKAGMGDVPVIIGGIVPDDDVKKLKKAGVAEVFHPGSSREEIVSRVGELAAAARAAKEQELLA